MTKDHLRFCLKRPDKALHARQLRLTVMIDDRVDVLQHLEGIVGQRLLFGEQSRPAPAWAIAVADWAAVRAWAAAASDTGVTTGSVTGDTGTPTTAAAST